MQLSSWAIELGSSAQTEVERSQRKVIRWRSAGGVHRWDFDPTRFFVSARRAMYQIYIVYLDLVYSYQENCHGSSHHVRTK